MRRLLLLLIAASSAGAAPASVPHYAEFGSWLVACDNMRSCEARGFDGKTEADLRIVRDAGDTPASVALTLSGRLDPDTLRLDEAPLPLVAGWTFKQEDGLATLSTVDPSAVRAFLRRVRDARRIAFGTEDAGVPLDGLTAALMRMDDVQGRAGTPTPLMSAAGPNAVARAPGLPSRPAWRAPAALSKRQASVLAATTRMAQAAALRVGDCDKTNGDQAHALDARHAVVVLSCMNHAYQSSSLVYVTPRRGGSAAEVALPLPTLPRQRDNALTEAGFNPASGTLSFGAKGRGLADCGLSASWVWSGGAFRLVEMTRQSRCGGAMPGDWPTLFRMAPLAGQRHMQNG